ncbi:Cytochrome [Abeliophyllum distichum]|uniref:Cytochrome n=1 Tax=Abeliophyllum distichum TaxID=126358 RepID=A0ABD1W012_9LAMI
MYKYLKNMVLNLFGPESLKKMLPDVEQASNTYLKRWSSQTMAEMKESTSKEENEAIIKKRANPDSGLTWNEYKSMKFTFESINETDRLANIVPGIFRKAPRDIKFKGHTIPASWVVMVCPQLCT